MKVLEVNGHSGSRHGGAKKVKMSRFLWAYRSYAVTRFIVANKLEKSLGSLFGKKKLSDFTMGEQDKFN